MKVAKANKADIDMAMELTQAFESLTQRWHPTVPDAIAKTASNEEGEPFDRDDREQCHRVLNHLLDLAGSASLMRVTFGCAVMLDPSNKCVDPEADTLEHHPDIQALETARSPRPASEYHEDMGDVMWWVFPVSEPPYCGKPHDSDWPGHHTHWTPLIVPNAPEGM